MMMKGEGQACCTGSETSDIETLLNSKITKTGEGYSPSKTIKRHDHIFDCTLVC
jgi:hypothetical protein